MVDSTDSGSGIKGYSAGLGTGTSVQEQASGMRLLLNSEALGTLSDAEIKFLSLSKEKSDSARIINSLIKDKLTLDNFEDMFCLKNYTPVRATVNPDQEVSNIRYRDKNGVIVAIVQIDKKNKKIRMQNLGMILPKQECFTPSQVGTKIQNLAKFNKWSTEDGGVNQFNGNVEMRYKDKRGNVMAAVIKKSNGVFDTIAEYEYKNGNRTQMLLTNHYGQSKVVYDGSPAVNQMTRIDIDTDGSIVEITKIYSEKI